MSDDTQKDEKSKAADTASGSKSEAGPHEQKAGATLDPSSPGETGTTPGSNAK